MKINNHFLVLMAVLVASFAFSQNEKTHAAEALEFPTRDLLIGKGINLLESKQIDATSFHYDSIFVKDKIINHFYISTTSSTRTSDAGGYNYSNYVKNTNYKINTEYGVTASLSDDLAKFNIINKGAIDFGKDEKYVGNEYIYTRSVTSVIETQYIDYYTNPKQLLNCAYAVFCNKLNSLNSTFSETLVEDIFKTYGTHILMKVEYGGKLNLNYKFSSSEYLIGEDTSFDSRINTLFGLQEKYINVSEIKKDSIYNGFTKFNVDGTTVSNLTSETIGGSAFPIMPYNILGNAVLSWANNINSNNCELLVNNNLVLVPIWSFASCDVSNKIANIFNKKYKMQTEQTLYSEVDYKTNISEQFYFGGGSNVKEKMYKVPSPKVMRDLGYNKVNISFTVDVHRKNIACPSECYLSLYYVDGTHTSQRLVLGTFNANKTSYMPFETKTGDISINNLEISFGNNISDYFKIRYDAKGTSESHDIVFKNLIIKYMK